MLRNNSFIMAALIALATFAADEALGVMGGPTIMSRVDTDGDHTLSLAEVRAAAGRRYDLIKSKNGGRVTMLQLGGRLVPADLKAVNGTPGVAEPVSREQYLALVDKFFDEADAKRTASDKPGTGRLNVNDLESAAGKKLVGLLQ